MKKIILLFSFLCLVAVSTWSAEDVQSIPITVIDNSIETSQTHRTPIDIPVMVYYDSIVTSINVQFLRDIGNVEIIITNMSNGSFRKYDVESNARIILLPITGDAGVYRVEFLLVSGLGYEGEFEIQ